jgi:hypothetical protein
MKKLVLIITAAILSCSAHAMEWKPSEDFLRAVRQVESSGGQFLYGDDGRSLGAFQLSEAAWADVNEWRKARKLKTYSYSGHALHSYLNQVYASNYLTMIHSELSRKLKRKPTSSEVYAAYNMGLGNFAECNYRLNQVNPVTAKKARQILAMVGRDL